MTKLHLTLITLFMLVSAQAQTITEKDLLGEWVLNKIELEDGTLIDLELQQVTNTYELIERFKDREERLQTANLQLLKDLERFRGTRLEFKSGFRYKCRVPGEKADKATYVIDYKMGKYYMATNEHDLEQEISIEDGLLKSRGTESDNFLYYKKVK